MGQAFIDCYFHFQCTFQPLRKFGLSQLMANLTSLRDLQWLRAKAAVLSHIPFVDQLRSLRLNFEQWEDENEQFLEQCSELRRLALSTNEESEKKAFCHSWRQHRPSGREGPLLHYLPNLTEFQLNVAPKLVGHLPLRAVQTLPTARFADQLPRRNYIFLITQYLFLVICRKTGRLKSAQPFKFRTISTTVLLYISADQETA